MDDEKKNLWDNISGWWAHPFNTQGSALNWVLFFGLFLVAVWFWTHTLMLVNDEI